MVYPFGINMKNRNFYFHLLLALFIVILASIMITGCDFINNNNTINNSNNSGITTLSGGNTSATTSNSTCPTDANNAASLYGGDSGSWRQLARGEWFYQNASQPLQNITFKGTIHVDWWDNYQNHTGGPGDVTVPFATQLTLYCNPG